MNEDANEKECQQHELVEWTGSGWLCSVDNDKPTSSAWTWYAQPHEASVDRRATCWCAPSVEDRCCPGRSIQHGLKTTQRVCQNASQRYIIVVKLSQYERHDQGVQRGGWQRPTNTVYLPECSKAACDRPLHVRLHWQVGVIVYTEIADCRRWWNRLGSNPYRSRLKSVKPPRSRTPN